MIVSAPPIYRAASFTQKAGLSCPHRGVKEMWKKDISGTRQNVLVADPCPRKTESSGYCIVHEYVMTFLRESRKIGFPCLQVNASLSIDSGVNRYETFAQWLPGPGEKPFRAIADKKHVPASLYEQVMYAILHYDH